MTVRIDRARISDSPVGITNRADSGPAAISISPNTPLHVENATFNRVERPYDLTGDAGGVIERSRARNITQSPPLETRRVFGWTPSTKPPLPVYCPDCHSVSASRSMRLNGGCWRLFDNEEECPNCGSHHARLGDGVFRFTEEAVEIISGPDITYAMAQAISQVAERVRTGAIDAEVGATEMSKIHKGCASLLSTAQKFGPGVVMILMLLFTGYGTYLTHQNSQIAKSQAEEANRNAAIEAQKDATNDWKFEQILEVIWRLAATSHDHSNERADDRESNAVNGDKSVSDADSKQLETNDPQP